MQYYRVRQITTCGNSCVDTLEGALPAQLSIQQVGYVSKGMEVAGSVSSRGCKQQSNSAIGH
eukprot:6213435-Pleurochrysis_carterae.AAC.4